MSLNYDELNRINTKSITFRSLNGRLDVYSVHHPHTHLVGVTEGIWLHAQNEYQYLTLFCFQLKGIQ